MQNRDSVKLVITDARKWLTLFLPRTLSSLISLCRGVNLIYLSNGIR